MAECEHVVASETAFPQQKARVLNLHDVTISQSCTVTVTSTAAIAGTAAAATTIITTDIATTTTTTTAAF